jgi:hypothetical protein
MTPCVIALLFVGGTRVAHLAQLKVALPPNVPISTVREPVQIFPPDALPPRPPIELDGSLQRLAR